MARRGGRRGRGHEEFAEAGHCEEGCRPPSNHLERTPRVGKATGRWGGSNATCFSVEAKSVATE